MDVLHKMTRKHLNEIIQELNTLTGIEKMSLIPINASTDGKLIRHHKIHNGYITTGT